MSDLVKHDGDRRTLLPWQQFPCNCDWLNVEPDLPLCLMDSEGGHNILLTVSSANELNFSVCRRWCPSFPVRRGELPFCPLGHIHIAVVDGVHSVVAVDPGENGCEDTADITPGSGW